MKSKAFSKTPQGDSMNLPEDRHPLLYVYVDVDHQQPDRVRSRCLTRGATNLLGKWPEHLTFSWMMGVICLASLFVCFFLVIAALITASSGHHYGKRSLYEKCERNPHVVQFVHMKNLEDLTANENATYFVEIHENKTSANESFCSVESYLNKTSSPVFLVIIYLNANEENLTESRELERKYKNFATITFDVNSFFNRTLFANFKTDDPKFLTFLAKVLVSWNVGGTVLDTRLKSLGDWSGTAASGKTSPDDKEVIIGTFGDEVMLISAKRFCHAFIFDVLKTIAETRNILENTQTEIIKAAKKRFCRGKWNCGGIRFLPRSTFCTWHRNPCTFWISETKESSEIELEMKLCPTVTSI